jgi:hypothetical protein
MAEILRKSRPFSVNIEELYQEIILDHSKRREISGAASGCIAAVRGQPSAEMRCN